jgi:hypothetical protein
VKHLVAGLAALTMMLSAQAALSDDGQSVSTNNWKTTELGTKCVVGAASALTTAGFKHVTSGKIHKDGSVILFADQGTYQATVFCLDDYIALEVTGPTDAKTSSLVDAFVKAWNDQ